MVFLWHQQIPLSKKPKTKKKQKTNKPTKTNKIRKKNTPKKNNKHNVSTANTLYTPVKAIIITDRKKKKKRKTFGRCNYHYHLPNFTCIICDSLKCGRYFCFTLSFFLSFSLSVCCLSLSLSIYLVRTRHDDLIFRIVYQYLYRQILFHIFSLCIY